MRNTCLAILWLVLCVTFASAQTTERFGAAGLGYYSQTTPQLQGWAALGIPLTTDGKAISYTDFDVARVKSGGQFSLAGVRIQYSMRTGVAYRIYQRGSWSLFGLAAPGFTANGSDFLSAFEYGGFLHKTVHKNLGLLLGLTNERYGDQSDLAPRIGLTARF